MEKVIINIDGGSRGNPGPAAIGIVFSTGKKYSQELGKKTNNEAEYLSLIFALKKAKAVFGKNSNKSFEIRSDSELLVKQMKGQYRIKNPEIQKLFLEAWNLKIEFKNMEFSLIPREENKEADKLVNEVLDGEMRKKALF